MGGGGIVMETSEPPSETSNPSTADLLFAHVNMEKMYILLIFRGTIFLIGLKFAITESQFLKFLPTTELNHLLGHHRTKNLFFTELLLLTMKASVQYSAILSPFVCIALWLLGGRPNTACHKTIDRQGGCNRPHEAF